MHTSCAWSLYSSFSTVGAKTLRKTRGPRPERDACIAAKQGRPETWGAIDRFRLRRLGGTHERRPSDLPQPQRWSVTAATAANLPLAATALQAGERLVCQSRTPFRNPWQMDWKTMALRPLLRKPFQNSRKEVGDCVPRIKLQTEGQGYHAFWWWQTPGDCGPCRGVRRGFLLAMAAVRDTLTATGACWGHTEAVTLL